MYRQTPPPQELTATLLGTPGRHSEPAGRGKARLGISTTSEIRVAARGRATPLALPGEAVAQGEREDVDVELTSWVSSRLDAEKKLSDDAKLLILAALEGRASLAEMAEYTPPAPEAETPNAADPVGAFLKQIKVRGFRGIGPESQLDLDPYPSMTVISGRNGSGKSSFAEALEVALTGTTYRWHARASQWKEQWRNLHNGDPARITVTLAEEGVGSTRLAVEWASDAALDGMVTSLQRQGEKKQAGLASLGWSGPLETYRPMLTYEELGALLAAEPKVLYDALSTVLGLEQLADAVKALDEHRKALSAPRATLRTEKRALEQSLASLTDERATTATTLISARNVDTDQLRRLATVAPQDNTVGARVRALLILALPRDTECRKAAEELTAAVSHLAEVGDRMGESLHRRSQLISAAISLHEHEGDQTCPVCERGTLGAERVAALRAQLESGELELAEMRAAGARHSAALNAARSLVTTVPSALTGDVPDELSVLVARLRDAWAHWAAAPSEPLALSGHLSSQSEPARQALAALKTAAEDYINAMDEAWSKVAARLAAFADTAQAWAGQQNAADAATSAHKWLRDNQIVLKNERVKPIADEARHIWSSLRQESNVEIAGLTLESSNTRRHVAIAAEVDGEDAGALAVMSQGELHALALALFLPRATMPQSPFRFVVLDDPVQAMDPAKVDGLVRVLLEIAKTRQVVVFSHDDRFASAVRRAPKDVPTKVLEVIREANSQVTPVITYSPADRYLRDAFGIVKDTDLPDDTLRRVLPGLLRMALEAQARETYFARELSRGASHEDVESTWEGHPKTRERLGLAIGDPTKIDAWLDKSNHRKWALRQANSVHFKLDHGEPIDACRDVEKTLADLKRGVK